MTFNVGDDAVIVMVNHKRHEIIRWRGKVEKVYKTGHVIVMGDRKFRQNGSSVEDGFRVTLKHWTPELQAQHDRWLEVEKAHSKLIRLCQRLEIVRDDDEIMEIMALIPDALFERMCVK